ncbi:ImmA/IrrE family metallo-endopeptidase [Paenibacillus lycopersici]|uniref:ImmA/IrrE family metallo-endopeptidase n=1 Tax=Paenibacillus lycopersici TaxID=2704462 RepID=A0A6C0G5D8_9BACL|nr:ImmA/IrrE family metallo-endopeptidase [Paenibacillus lycopersici]QHT63603.1 ImmA/IrrE family metallo-endopeptidase [Paenibacillus lycopersici]
MNIEQLVRKLVRKHGTTDPFKLAAQMKVTVQILDLPCSCRGYYLRTLRRRFIAINQNLSDVWQRVVCAHELGHDQLHRGISRFFLDESSFFVAGRYETEANEFAVQLLLYNERPEEEESIDTYFMRHNIPTELTRYY